MEVVKNFVHTIRQSGAYFGRAPRFWCPSVNCELSFSIFQKLLTPPLSSYFMNILKSVFKTDNSERLMCTHFTALMADINKSGEYKSVSKAVLKKENRKANTLRLLQSNSYACFQRKYIFSSVKDNY